LHVTRSLKRTLFNQPYKRTKLNKTGLLATKKPNTTSSLLGTALRFYAAATPPIKDQDVIIIGGGPGGYVAAIKAAQLGLKTTCIEKRGTLGGTCLNVGCIPSKALLHISHMYEQTKHYMPSHGIKIEGTVSVDLPTLMKAKLKAVNSMTSGVEYLFKKNKVTYVQGFGKFKDANTISVDALDGSTTTVSGKNIVIATGSEPSSLPGIEVDEQRIITSTGALDLKKVPQHLILIGGGIIGLEMGSVWSRLGSKVTVVEFTDGIAAGADGEIAKQFKKLLENQGLKFKMRSKVTAAKKTDKNIIVTVEDLVTNKIEQMDCDVVLVAVGRRPYTDGLGLEKVGVKLDSRGRVVTEHFKTNIPHIYAIGDVISGPMLAHKAEEEGIAVAEDIASPGVGHVNYNAIPSVVYTHPEVAWVGETEEQLKARGVAYNVGQFPFKANSRAKTNDDFDGMVKFLGDKETDRVLGVHIIGSDAGELIAESVLGMEYGASCEDIARTCHAHPTLSEAVKEAAMSVYSKPIHY